MSILRSVFQFRFFILLFTALLATKCASQSLDDVLSKSYSKKFQKANELLLLGETNEALEIYQDVLNKYPELAEVHLKIGVAYLDLASTEMAINYLEKALSLGYKQDVNIYSTLGDLHRRTKSFERSIVMYESYLEKVDSSSASFSKAKDILSHLYFIQNAIDNPENIQLTPLPEEINTPQSEYLAQFAIDGQSLVFTRRVYGQEDLFYARKAGDSYDVSEIASVNTPLNEGAHTLSADGNVLIFTHCNDKFGYGGCDLYLSKKTGELWSRPRNLGSKINTLAWESQPSLSTDGRTLYFSSNRKGSIGNKDIWVTNLSKDGVWESPTNLGPTINTRQNEESPFIHPDNKSLYFRSNGHKGLGSYDIYLARHKDRGWETPLHLGTPINSPENDGALVISLDGSYGYFASDYADGAKQNHLDIFEFVLPPRFRPDPMTFVKGRVIDNKSKYPLTAEVHVVDLTTGEVLVKRKADLNGEFLFAVPVRKELSIHIAHNGYTFFSSNVNFDDVRHGVDPFIEDIYLSPTIDLDTLSVEPEPIVLDNIFFESGSAQLLPKSSIELDYLFDMLNQNSTIRIKISGHTDDVGSPEDNLVLSEARAISVKNALIKMGIMEDRIVAVGMGEEQPVADNESEVGRAKNRRTEFILIR